jgi:hypothetical protein
LAEKIGNNVLQIGIVFCSTRLMLPPTGGNDGRNSLVWKLPGVAELGGWALRIRTVFEPVS